MRFISNTLEIYLYKRETYFHELRELLDHNTLEECQNLMNRVVECRHQRILDWQKSKFEALYQQKTNDHSNMGGHSNHTTTTRAVKSNKTSKAPNVADKTSIWVKNLSNMPLTEAKECLLAHRSKFAISLNVHLLGDT